MIKNFRFVVAARVADRRPINQGLLCYADLGSGMHLRYLWFITLIGLCHLQMGAQMFTLALPPADTQQTSTELPNDPGQEILPVAVPEPIPPTGVPVHWESDRQTHSGDLWTLTGNVILYYDDYILHADNVVYHQSTTIAQAEGHLMLTGGPEDLVLKADHGEMRLNAHTGRFYQITGSLGVRNSDRTLVYTTTNPFLFKGRVLLQKGQGYYQVLDGSMTNCRLPKPNWELISHAIQIKDGQASTINSRFKLLGIPLFYLPYLRHSASGDPRETGLLIPIFSYSSIKGMTLGEEIYIVLGRSADLTMGAEYYSKRGFSPNGAFRYRGQDLDHLNARWNALLDRRVGSASLGVGNQGGVDVLAEGRYDFSLNTHVAGTAEYLSHYLYRLAFNNNYTQAIDSTVRSEIAYTINRNGLVLSANAARFQSYGSIASGDETRILHLPGIHVDLIDQPLGSSHLYGELSASVDHMGLAEPGLHARNDGRMDIFPRLSLPVNRGGWSIVPSAAVRLTAYTDSQISDLTDQNNGIPTVSHNGLLRRDIEGTLDIRPPTIERDFKLTHWGRELRHVIEPEIYFHAVTGIGKQAQDVLLVDTNDIATNTTEAGFSITQRIYLRPVIAHPCSEKEASSCNRPREWASWQIAQKYFFDPQFGGAVIGGNRNVFDSALDFTGTTFLTGARSNSPILSRLRFEAVDNLRIEWDMDYDPRANQVAASNLYAGYSWGRTTVGLGHSLLNAVDEMNPAYPQNSPLRLSSLTQYQQLQPFFSMGKPTDSGLSLAANGGYDLTHGKLQYGGVQAIYNRGCCGITVGYRRFALGTVREEDQYLYGFTLAGFGTAGDVRRSNTVFRDPKLPPLY